MNNIEELLADSSKLSALRSAEKALENPDIIAEIIKTAFQDKAPLSMRAANIIQICDEINPDLIEPYYSDIIFNLPKFKTDGVKRCFLKLITKHPEFNNEEWLGLLTNLCFEWITSAKETVAVKVYAMEILANIATIYPDLMHEIRETLEAHIPNNSLAFKSRALKILNKRDLIS